MHIGEEANTNCIVWLDPICFRTHTFLRIVSCYLTKSFFPKDIISTPCWKVFCQVVLANLSCACKTTNSLILRTIKVATQKMKSSISWSLLSITYLLNSEGTTNHRHPHEHKLWPLLLTLPLRGRVYTNTYQRQKRITEAKAFNITFRYIDDVLSINNTNFPNITGVY